MTRFELTAALSARCLSSVAVGLGGMLLVTPAEATDLGFGGFNWVQENCPNTGTEIVDGVVGGARFNVDTDDTTSNVTGFPATVMNGVFDDQIGILSVIIGDQPNGTRAVNLPYGANINQLVDRRGLSVGWLPGTVGGGGVALPNPTLPNGPGTDFVIFESGSPGVPEGMMVRVRVANDENGPFFTDWHYFARQTETAATNATLHAYEYDLDAFGLGPTDQIDLIEIANMVAADRVDGMSMFLGAGAPPPPFNPFRPAMGQFGGCVELDGDSDFGWFQSPLVDIGSLGTLNVWVSIDNTAKRNQILEGPENAGLEAQYRSNGGGQFFARGEADSANGFAIQDGGAAAVAGGMFANLQVTWDAANSEIHIYLNDTEVTYLNATFDSNVEEYTLATALSTVDAFMNIGRDPGDPSRYFDGLLDDLAFFDVVLGMADRDNIRTNGVAAYAGGDLIAHWDLDQPMGTVAIDNANGIPLNFERQGQFGAEGPVLPEAYGTQNADNPGAKPGPIVTFDIPFGNATFDPDPLYVAVLHNLQELMLPPPERAHPGWNSVSAEITLTKDQPAYWAVSTGQPLGVPPFIVLDPDPTGVQPGRPDPDGSTDRVLRGYVVGWAVNSTNQEIRWNHLKGDACIVNYAHPSAWEYNAWAFQVVNGVANGAQTGDPGVLNLDGTEYAAGFSQLVLDFYASGAEPFSSAFNGANVDTDLTLHPLDVDLRQEDDGPVTTKAKIDIWNEHEVKFNGTERCITCWDQRLLSHYTAFGVPNSFVYQVLGTDKGKARIEGLASDNCDFDFEFDPLVPFGADPRDIVSQPASLLGVAAKHLSIHRADVKVFDAAMAGVARSGLNLVGMGTEGGVIRYDVLDASPEAAGGDHSFSTRARRNRRAIGGTESGPGTPQDRVSGTEKGSLLYFSKVELRWTEDGEFVQDTFLDISNDLGEDVAVQMYFINGDPPLPAELP